MKSGYIKRMLIVLWIAACGCDGSQGVTGPSRRADRPGSTIADPCQVLKTPGSANPSYSATGIFTVSPLEVVSISSIVPLGNLNPPLHVYPTDHISLFPHFPATDANNVSAAASGTVVDISFNALSVYQPYGYDWKITIETDQSFYYYYDHITPFSGLVVGSPVIAGEIVGWNSGDTRSVDFGVYNFNNAPLPGILNACALEGEAYIDSPLKYYSGDLQASLYDKVAVSGGATMDGKIDYDVAGELVGNWVLTGHRSIESWTNGLAFVYNVSDHSPRISAGTLLAGGGTFGVQAGVDFTSITATSGQVNFRLYPTTGGDSSAPGAEYGVLAVQMLSPTRIKVEIFPGNLTGTATFDANALTFDR